MEAKATARLRGRERRAAMSPDERAALDRAIVARCKKELAWPKYKKAMVFLPIERLSEIDTWPLVLWLWENRRRTRVFVPQILGGKMQAVQITPQSTFSNSKWGIPEPADGPILMPNESLDLVLIPLLGFDARGQRVGYGKGYFDRFLKDHKAAQLVGLGYECLFSPDGIEAEPHDVPLDAVITESRIHTFGQ